MQGDTPLADSILENQVLTHLAILVRTQREANHQPKNPSLYNIQWGYYTTRIALYYMPEGSDPIAVREYSGSAPVANQHSELKVPIKLPRCPLVI